MRTREPESGLNFLANGMARLRERLPSVFFHEVNYSRFLETHFRPQNEKKRINPNIPITLITREQAAFMLDEGIKPWNILLVNNYMDVASFYYSSILGNSRPEQISSERMVALNSESVRNDPVTRAVILLRGGVKTTGFDFDGTLMTEFDDRTSSVIPGSVQLESFLSKANRSGLTTLDDVEKIWLAGYIQFILTHQLGNDSAFENAGLSRIFREGVSDLLAYLANKNFPTLIVSRQFDMIVETAIRRIPNLPAKTQIQAISVEPNVHVALRGVYKGLAVAELCVLNHSSSVVLFGDSKFDITMLDCQNYGVRPAVFFVLNNSTLDSAIKSGKYDHLLKSTQVFRYNNGHDMLKIVKEIDERAGRLKTNPSFAALID